MNETMSAAAVLEGAADLLLVNGRCRDAGEDDAGRLCVIGALLRVYVSAPACTLSTYEEAHRCLRAIVPDIVGWNGRTDDDDEVRDTLLLCAKAIRNGET